MPSRRSLLASAVVATVSSCIESTPGASGETGGDGTPTRTPTPDPAEDEPGVHRGRDEVDLHATERFDEDDDFTYYPDNETVRYPRTYDQDGVATYGKVTFEEFTEIQCPRFAMEPARVHVEDELDEDVAYRSGIGEAGSIDGVFPRFTYYTEPGEDPNREGDRPATEMPLEEFVDVVPRTVSVTLTFQDREHDCAVPVYVVEE